MADLTQPATAAEFIAAGADPVAARQLASQHNLMSGREGSFDERVDFAHFIENQPPPPKAAPTPQTSNAQLADASAQHQDHQLAGTMDAAFAPPAMAYEYKLEDESSLNDAQLAANSELKTALHAAQMPKFVVESIAQNLAEASRTLANETPDQARFRIESQKGRLEGMWGKDNLAGNLRIVDAFLEQQSAKSPALRSFLGVAARALTPLDLDLLLQVAKHRASNPGAN
jgi:hypothetical protein